MKHINQTLLLLLLCTTNLLAQNNDSPWLIGAGLNFVDYYPVKENTLEPELTGNATGFADEYFNIKSHWNTQLSRIQIGRYLGDGFTFEVAPSINKITKMGDNTIANKTYLAFDGNIKYALKHLFGKSESTFFQPYIYIGGGYTWLNKIGAGTTNIGLGSNFWFSKKLAITLQTGYKNDFEDYFNAHFQHSLGIVYRFGKKVEDEEEIENIDTDGDGMYDRVEDENGTDKNNNCSFKIEFQEATPNLTWINGDCDGDGVTNNTEKTDGTDILNPCDYKESSITLIQSEAWENADCDGDGVSNKTEKEDGTSISNPCDYNTKSVSLNQSNAWKNGDCDEDGIKNELDDDALKEKTKKTNTISEKTKKETNTEFIIYSKRIHFVPDKSDFRLADSQVALNEILKIMLKYPNQNYVIEGHADSRMSYKYNQKLSELRANAVKDWLINHGVDSSKLTAIGYGERKPIATNMYMAGRALNRRVEVKMLGKVKIE